MAVFVCHNLQKMGFKNAFKTMKVLWLSWKKQKQTKQQPQPTTISMQKIDI